MNSLIQDVRYALRQLRKSPGFTITAVLTLAVGIGANAGIFSVMDAVVLRPLAVPDLDRVMTVYEQQNHSDNKPVALGNFEDWKRQSHSFEEMAARSSADMALTGAGDAAHVTANWTSPSFFSVMRTNAFLGRLFDAGETQPGHDRVAVLSYAFWKSHFDSDAGIVGREIELDQHTYNVIGVLPKTVQYPSQVDVFLPFAATDAQLANRSGHDYLVLGRLRPGVKPQDAQSELNLIADRLAKQYPATNLGWSVRVESLLAGINGDLTPLYMKLIQAATLFVLLVVCANLANLQFARGISRRNEIAVRTALGASRSRLVRQLITESVLLGLIGAGFGLAYAQVYLRLTLISMPEKVARYMAGWSNVSLNARSVELSVLLALAAGVVAGLSPALEALRVNLVGQLKSGSRSVSGSGRRKWLASAFAVAQISLAVALVAGAALMSKGMTSLMHVTDPYNPTHMLIFNVHLPVARYDSAQKQAAWLNQSLDKLRALPGVQIAETTATLPSSDNGWVDDTQIENRPAAPGKFQSALRLPVSAGYFAAFHIPVLSGRGFAQGDNLGAQPVAVVSHEYAKDYFPGENPIGRHIRMGTGRDQTPWLTIIGVAQDADYFMFVKNGAAAVYMDSAQLPQLDMIYSVITKGDPIAVAPEVRKTLAAIDPALPLDDLQTYAKYMSEEKLTGIVYVAVLLGVNAIIALVLAAIGIFGVMANLVGERTREIGVRLAMGARREDVLRMILRRAGILTGTGLGIGLVMAFALANAIANLFFGVSPNDPVVFGSITAAVAGIALLASWLPARRAARVDPIVALRDE
jgi:putative ABC transport system permease protein